MMMFASIALVFADEPVQIASGTFNGKNATYTEGWTTTGTGVSRTDCIIIGADESITSPEVDLSQYESISVAIKARRFGTLSGSKAEIAVTFDGEAIGNTVASGTSATTALDVINYEVGDLSTGNFVVTCTNATSAGSTHGAGINSIVITGVLKSQQGGGEDPQPTHTYTVAGDNADLFGTTWAPTNTDNDMTLVEGVYTWEKTNMTMPAGNVAFKVVEDHSWDNASYPADNYVLNIPEAGVYTITITYNPADNNAVNAVAQKTGSAVVIPTVAMHGNFGGQNWADTENFAVAEGNETASLTLNLAAGDYEFGMRIGGAANWTANGAAFTRENNSAVIVAGQGNITLDADAAGEYTFTWTYATNTLTVTYPEFVQPTYTYADGYYLIGLDMQDWTMEYMPTEGRLFAANPDNEGEYQLTITLAADQQFKVVSVQKDQIKAWYPDGMDNNFIVDAAHAGEKTVYFRPDGQGGQDWHYGCIYVAANEDQPEQPEMTAIYDWAGEIGTTIIGGDKVTLESVKIHTYTDNVPAIKFASSYVYAEGKWLAIKPAEGGFKAGDVVSVAGVISNADDTGAKYAQIDVYAADGATRLLRSENIVNGKVSADEPVIVTLALEADQDSLFLGRYGNTNMFITLLKVERAAGEEPVETPKFYITGNAALVGQDKEWNPGAIPSMEDSKVLALEAGSYMMKITTNGAWEGENNVKGYDALTGEIPAGVTRGENENNDNICFTLAEAGDVTVTYTAESFTIAGNFYVYVPQFTDGYYLVGNQYNWTPAAERLFKANPEAEGEFFLDSVVLAADDSLKVVYVENDQLLNWYPEGNNYVVDANHAGTKTIYFNPTYQKEWGGNIFITENPAPKEYYAKYAEAWEWVKLTEAEGLWLTDTIVYKGTGININDKAADEDNLFYSNEEIEGALPIAGAEFKLNDTIRFSFNPADSVVTAIMIAEYVAPDPTASVRLEIMEWDETPFELAADKQSASLTINNIHKGNYAFKMFINGEWRSNAGTISRENPAAIVAGNEDGNMTLKADIDGIYTFKWFFANDSLVAIFPEKPVVPMTEIRLVPGVWNVDGAKFAAVTWNEGEVMEDGVVSDWFVGTDTVVGNIPAAADSIGFARFNGEAAAPSIEDQSIIWNHTDKMLIDKETMIYTITGWPEEGKDYCPGYWGAPYVPVLENGFYLVGNKYNWTPAAEHLFTANPETEGEYFLAEVTLEENDSIKVVMVVNDEITDWYPNGDNYVVDAAHAGMKTIYFNPTYQEAWGNNIYIEANAAPFTCDWDNIAWLDGSNDQIKVCKESDAVSVINVQKPGWAAEKGIYMTFPSAAWGAISLEEGSYVTEGAGLLVYLSALTQEYNEISIVCQDVEYIINVYNAANAPKPAFYLVGNFNEWTAAEAYKFALNPNNDAEYVLTATLAEKDSLKVIRVMEGEETVWYPADAENYVVDAAHAGEKDIYFRPDYQGGEDWYAQCIYVAENAPQGCDWDHIDFIGSAVPELADQFKLCKEGQYPSVINIQNSFGTEAGIYVTFPSAAFGEISMTEGTYAIQGAGMLLYCSAFTDVETEVSIVCDGNPIIFTVYNAEGSAPVVDPTVSVKGSMNDWAEEIPFVLSDDKTYASLTVENIGADEYEFKFIINGEWRSNGYRFHREFTGAAGITENNEANMIFVADQDGQYTFYWYFANDSAAIVYPEYIEPVYTLTNGYYLVGKFGGEDAWDPVADNLLAQNPDNNAEYQLAINLAVGDEIKVVEVENDAIKTWFPNEGGNYVIDDHHNGATTMYFRPDYQGGEDWFAGCIYVVPTSHTDIDNVNAAVEAVKIIRDGQLFIIKGEKMYNVMGQTIK